MKIIAREIEPENIDFSSYFDNDCFNGYGYEKEEDRLYSKLFIISGDRHSSLNKDDYEDLLNRIDEISEDFLSISDGAVSYNGFATYKEVMEYYSIEYTPQKCNDLKDLLLNLEYPVDTADVARYLEIESGKKFDCIEFKGYNQGDYCDIIYSPEYYSYEGIKEIADMYLGKGTEFEIDDCYGYFVSDDIRRKEGNELVEYLAEMSGFKPEELDVRLYEGEQKIPIYSKLSYEIKEKNSIDR